MKELERERNAVEDDRAQVDRYKQLLLKQRDIMLALTKRLNDRDEQILTLQEELDAYDKYQRKLEDALDERTAELITLRKAAMEHANMSPMKNSQLQTALDAWGVENGPHAALGSPRIAAMRDGGGAVQHSDAAPASPHSGAASDSDADAVVEAQRAEILRLQRLLSEAESRQASTSRGADSELEASRRQVAALQKKNEQLQGLLSEHDDLSRARESQEQMAQLQLDNQRLRQHLQDTVNSGTNPMLGIVLLQQLFICMSLNTLE